MLSIVKGKLPPECTHQHVELDEAAGTLRCFACGFRPNPMKYLADLIVKNERHQRGLDQKERDIKDAHKSGLHLIAAKKAERAWRSKSMVPTCPHCHAGIFPEDGFGGSAINRDMETRRRKIARDALRFASGVGE